LNLFEKILKDMQEAMKGSDRKRRDTLKMLISELKYAQVAGDKKVSLNDTQVLQVIASYKKKLTKALVDYPSGEKREALQAEIKIVMSYLPKMATAEEIDKLIVDLFNSKKPAQMGHLIKETMSKLGAGADGKLVSTKVREFWTNKENK
jgi:uncharacterized protein YqeY